MTTSLENLVRDTFVGKTLTKIEFANVNPKQKELYGKKILKTNIINNWGKIMMWFHFEDGTDFLLYTNEDVTVE